MPKRDFFILVFKLFGVYFLIHTLLWVIPQNFSLLNYNPGFKDYLFFFGIILFQIGVYTLLTIFSPKIVDVLQLEKGFSDDNLIFDKIDASTILKISVFILGGFLIVKSIPEFVSHLVFAFKNHAFHRELDDNLKINWLKSILNGIVGIFLISNYHWISEKFQRK